MSPATLRARAAGYFLTPRPPSPPTGDLIPLVRRQPPPPTGPTGSAARRDAVAPEPLTDAVRGGAVAPEPLADAVRGGAVAPEPLAEFGTPPPVDFVPPAHQRGRLFARGRAAGRDSEPRAPARLAVSPGGPTGLVTRAAVLGPAEGAVPAAAALACALRATQGFAAAVVATWTPGVSPRPRGPGAPGAIRVASRLAGRGLEAEAHGRLAWLPLGDHVLAATVAARRASATLDVPLVIAIAGPRCDIVEALLCEQDFIVVAAPDPDAPLARLAVAGCSRRAIACAPPAGVRRVLALAGLAGARALPEAVATARTSRGSRQS